MKCGGPSGRKCAPSPATVRLLSQEIPLNAFRHSYRTWPPLAPTHEALPSKLEGFATRGNELAEEPKRLEPTKETLRALFLKSGNLCAYPTCEHLMMNAHGAFIGQICHIEAAERGGARFNPDQTNEDRRAFSNLMLLCYEHHVVTNNVTDYDVARLKEMKAAHEARFTDVATKMQGAFWDLTVNDQGRRSHNFKRVLNEEPDLPSDDERTQILLELEEVRTKLAKVPRPSRDLLAILIARSHGIDDPVALHEEIVQACGRPSGEVMAAVGVLQRHGLAEDWWDEDEYQAKITLRDLARWPLWATLRDFCDRSGVPLTAIIAELRFDLLDEDETPVADNAEIG